ncbi:hypothetical protein Csa_010813 [Cucumis sativus]|nr:hypothetical protein Csa_010813 [Cucumis sativus]
MGHLASYFSLPLLQDPRIERLTFSIRVLLESAIHNCDEFQVKFKDVEKILDWEKTCPRQVEIPFKPCQSPASDFTGLPAVIDLACMKDAVNNIGGNSNKVIPLVGEKLTSKLRSQKFGSSSKNKPSVNIPVDLVIDHSVEVDMARSEKAVEANMELDFHRNKERFAFLK